MHKSYVKVKKVSSLPEEKPVDLLHWLDIELTHGCNNHCIHCNVNLFPGEKEKEPQLNTAEWKSHIRDAFALGCKTIRITGGEPLLREDFVEIYRYIRHLGIKVVLFTNATRIDEKMASLLSEPLPGEVVEVTLYGMTKKSYEAVSQVPGSFDKAMRGIGLLKDKGIPFIVKSVYLPPNYSELDQFIQYGQSIKWQNTNLQVTMMLNLRTRRDSEEKNRLIRTLRPDPATVVGFMKRSGMEYRREMLTWIARQKPSLNDKLFTCGAGFKYAAIDPHGTLKPCLSLYHPDTIYTLKKGSLRDAMAGFFPEMRKKRAKNGDYLKKCAKCFIEPLCEQCPVKSWTEHGQLDQPVEYFCRIAHQQARSLGLLAHGEYGWRIKDGEKRIGRLVSELG